MFRSAIKFLSPLSIVKREVDKDGKPIKNGKLSQKNGLILDTDGALFLAKFVLTIAKYYNEEKASKNMLQKIADKVMKND